MPPEAALIEIRNATLYRGSTCVFENLNLHIGLHEQTAILGPNGAGKTTLLKLINREIYPVATKASSVNLLGRESWNVWDLRSEIGIVSDDLQSRYLRSTAGLDVVLSGFFSSIGMHGLLAKRITDAQRKRARDIMLDLGVGAYANVPLCKMSTGQQRRCLLARALVHDPATLILDEPTNGLDPTQIQHMRRLIRELARTATVILSTHILPEVQAICDRVIIIRTGRKVLDARLDELQGNRRLLLTSDARPKQLRDALQDVATVTAVEPLQAEGARHSYALALDDGGQSPETAPLVASTVLNQGFRLYALHPEQRDLETIFSEITA